MTLTRSQTNADDTLQSEMAQDIDSTQSNMASAIDCTSLAANIADLQAQFTAFRTDTLATVRAEYDNKLHAMQIRYDDKLGALESKLNAVTEAQSKSTIESIKMIVEILDRRINETSTKMANCTQSTETIVRDHNALQESLRCHETKVQNCTDNLNNIQKEFNGIYERAEAELNRPTPSSPAVPVPESSSLSLKDLESRIDKLEDFSRRDNLLFFGFAEQREEDCADKVKRLICDTILKGDTNAKNIEFIRVHRLGQYNSEYKRAIIVKFREYKDKMCVLKAAKNLQQFNEENSTLYTVSEDFSLNTKNIRKGLLIGSKICIF